MKKKIAELLKMKKKCDRLKENTPKTMIESISRLDPTEERIGELELIVRKLPRMLHTKKIDKIY